MKVIKMISTTIILCLMILMLPTGVEAKEKVNVYLFWGDGCPHCESAKEFFTELKADYPEYFELHLFEVWYNEKNNGLLEDVAKELGEEVSGVPFIVVGDKTFAGYNESIGTDIKNTILDQYENNKSNDVVDKVINQTGNNIQNDNQSDQTIIILLSIVVLCGGLFFVFKKKRKR